ncbi:MAG: 3-dehydroquinate synthase [Bacteriovoracaceae bacterium]|nr:3-dehydroquinate synthase [Bacteriovoracaceae bacterium]
MKLKSNLHFIELEKIINSIRGMNFESLIIIIDLNLHSQYFKKMDFDSLGKKVIIWKAPPGENCKNFKEFETCLEFLLEKGVHRNSHLLAIGGGALSDYAGFIASTLLRGISWSIIPTSLLSMIDASIGGKVAINSISGKNLIGSFHNPDNIYIDDKFIATLPVDEFQSGLGELAKYGILSKDIKKLILGGADICKIIQACAKFKQDITTKDLKESGERKILNLGHTIGHALEYIYQIKHGIAVFWGMIFIFIIFQKKRELDELIAIKRSLGIKETEPPWLNKTIPIADLMRFITKDKKTIKNNTLEVILPGMKNQVTIKEVSLMELETKIVNSEAEVKKFVIS